MVVKMNIDERKAVNKRAEKMAKSCTKINDSELAFVLKNNANQYIIGIHDLAPTNEEEDYVYFSNSHKLMSVHEMFDRQPSDLNLENCPELEIILRLNNGYEITYMTLDLHVMMWDYIDTYISCFDKYMMGLKKYLTFAKETGINIELLNETSDIPINDLYTIFLDDIGVGYTTVLKHELGGANLTLGFAIGEPYLISIKDEKENRTVYKDFHGHLDNAYEDFLDKYYTMHIEFHKNNIHYFEEVLGNLKDYLVSIDAGDQYE